MKNKYKINSRPPEKRKSLRRFSKKRCPRGFCLTDSVLCFYLLCWTALLILSCFAELLSDCVRSLCDIKHDQFACRKLLDRVHHPGLRNAGCNCVVDRRSIICRKDLIDGVHVN